MNSIVWGDFSKVSARTMSNRSETVTRSKDTISSHRREAYTTKPNGSMVYGDGDSYMFRLSMAPIEEETEAETLEEID